MSHILSQNSDEAPEIGAPIIADIFRFDPSTDAEPRMQRYVVPYRRRMSVLTLLREIYEHQDPTLAFRNQQCGRGICGTCQMRIGKDGKLVKSCRITLEPGSHVTVMPFSRTKVVRDLVVDM